MSATKAAPFVRRLVAVPKSIVEAPVVRVAVPADEGQAKDLLGDRADTVVGITLFQLAAVSCMFDGGTGARRAHVGRAPELGDDSTRGVEKRLGSPAELSKDLHVGQSRHLQTRMRRTSSAQEAEVERGILRYSRGLRG